MSAWTVAVNLASRRVEEERVDRVKMKIVEEGHCLSFSTTETGTTATVWLFMKDDTDAEARPAARAPTKNQRLESGREK